MYALLYLLAILWALGTAVAIFNLAQDLVETMLGGIVVYAVAIPVWVFIGIGPLFMLRDHQKSVESGVLATLYVSDWQCSASKQTTTTTYVQSGKVMVPITSTSSTCIQYSRKEQP